MGCGKGLLPLSTIPGREVTTDTLLLAELAASIPCQVCFDLGTGTGEVLKNASFEDTFSVGVDISTSALKLFDTQVGQPVLCSVSRISSLFREGCADLVLANPPYNDSENSRPSPDPLRREAREGGPLLLYRFIFAGAHLLKPGGCMIITGRLNKSDDIETGLLSAGFANIEKFGKGKVIAMKARLLGHS